MTAALKATTYARIPAVRTAPDPQASPITAASTDAGIEAAPLIAHIFWIAHSPVGATLRTPRGNAHPSTNPAAATPTTAIAMRPAGEAIRSSSGAAYKVSLKTSRL